MDVVVLLALGGRELERDRAPRHTIVFAIGYLNLAPRHLLVNCSLEQSHTHYSSSSNWEQQSVQDQSSSE